MKEELIVLGTGHAVVTKCYNTCFAIKNEEGDYFLVDTGGGSGILVQLEKAGIKIPEIHHVFLTHGQTDHLTGLIWLVRLIAAMMNGGKYQGNFHIYGHDMLMKQAEDLMRVMFQDAECRHIGKRILFIPVEDGEEKEILGHNFCFFDIQSTKLKQFGFKATLQSGTTVTCCGDEPFNEYCRPHAQGSDWLLHEAFCLYDQRDIFKPYEKHHSTAKDACELAADLGVKNVVLWHTEDKNIKRRKSLYKKEGRKYFKGGIYVPYDLERIEL